MMRASDGASIKWTKEVWSRTCKHGAVLVDGSIRASRRTDEMAEILTRKLEVSTTFYKQAGSFECLDYSLQ